jgi:UDP-N-acetylmuramoyl-tripeptide--D-alanyl-D-alanine ligase
LDLLIRDILTATGGRLESGHPEIPVVRISTDTRTLHPGDCFIALRGERFDGHDFIAEALLRGARSVVVDHPVAQAAGVTQVVVPETLRAMGDIAAFWRRRMRTVRLSVVVGSNGKTTTKEMAGRVVAAARRTLCTEGNLNNLVGVPRMLFDLSSRHEAAVLELGMNRPGEMARLAQIAQADCVALLNIRDAHIGNFGSQEALFEAKSDALRYSPSHACLIVNADDPLASRAVREYGAGRQVTTFGLGAEADVSASDLSPLSPFGTRFRLNIRGEKPLAVELRAFGRHNVWNALAAAAIGRLHGVPAETIALQLSLFHAAGSRSEVEERNGYYIIKDYYNASPAAVEAALRSLADFHVPGRRVALLADMLELGAEEERYHRAVGEAAAEAGVHLLLTLGQRAAWIADGARARGLAAEHMPDAEAAATRLSRLLEPGDLLLMKGSRLMKLEQVYERLKG